MIAWTGMGRLGHAGAALLLVASTGAIATRGLPAPANGTAAAAAKPASPLDAPEWAPFSARIAQAKAAMLGHPEQTLAIAGEAARLASLQPDGPARAIALATAHWLQGEALTRLNRPQESDRVLAGALKAVARYQPGTELHAGVLQSAGSAAILLGRAAQALAYLEQAHTISHTNNEPRGEASALAYISMIYNNAGDYERVLQYQSRAAEIYAGDANFALSTHNNRGNALRDLKRFGQAEAEYRLALAAAQKLGSASLQARILTNIASAQERSGHLDEAEASADRGLRLAADPTAANWRPFLWGVKAQVAFRRGDTATAAADLRRTFDGVDLAHTPMPYREFHEFAARLYERMGEDRLAFAHLQAFKRLEDESRTLAANTNAALMAARFDFANQDLRISRLKTGQLERDVLLARSKARMHQLMMAAFIAAFALLLLLYFSIRRSRNRLSVTNAQLEKALKAKTEFLATTSHEIRTPLNGILGMTQVILHDPAVDGMLRERMQVVHGAGETMKALVDDLLDVAKMETGNLAIHREETNLRPLLEEVVRLWSGQARTKGVALELDIAGAPPRVLEDGARLRQILFNLLSNAIKFTEQGAVRLSVAAVPAGDGEALEIRVADSGIGIPEDQLARIFESFHQVDGGTTRRYGGTGLGLAICRNVARTMGGDVTVESRLGEGSTFILSLPLTRVEAAAGGTSGGTGGRPLAECRLLLVERNPLAQSIVRAVVENEVAAFAVAGGGDEALAMLADGGFDLILAEGGSVASGTRDRLASVAALAAAAPGAELTLLWAELDEETRAALIDRGARRVLAKPISAKAVLEALKSPADTVDPDASFTRKSAA